MHFIKSKICALWKIPVSEWKDKCRLGQNSAYLTTDLRLEYIDSKQQENQQLNLKMNEWVEQTLCQRYADGK